MRLSLRLTGLLLCVGLGAGCSTRPSIKSVSARITDIDLKGVALVFDINVHNPYPMAIPTPNYRYGIDVAAAKLLDGKASAAKGLPAMGVGTISLPARFEYLKLWQMVKNLRDAREVDYELHGALMMSAAGQDFEVPFDHKGTFPVLRPPSISIRDVNTSDVSLRRAAVTVEADIENPNVCSLGVDTLGYALRLGDINVGNVTASTAGDLAAGKTGKLRLTGEISGMGALRQLMSGGDLGTPRITPRGHIKTPYGKVSLPD